MPKVQGGYVNFDARPGDMINTTAGFITATGEGKVRGNYCVADTQSDGVLFYEEPGRKETFVMSYNALANDRAYYVAKLVPVKPPETFVCRECGKSIAVAEKSS